MAVEDFIGPIEVAWVPGKGRGILVQREVQQGSAGPWFIAWLHAFPADNWLASRLMDVLMNVNKTYKDEHCQCLLPAILTKTWIHLKCF